MVILVRVESFTEKSATLDWFRWTITHIRFCRETTMNTFSSKHLENAATGFEIPARGAENTREKVKALVRKWWRPQLRLRSKMGFRSPEVLLIYSRYPLAEHGLGANCFASWIKRLRSSRFSALRAARRTCAPTPLRASPEQCLLRKSIPRGEGVWIPKFTKTFFWGDVFGCFETELLMYSINSQFAI